MTQVTQLRWKVTDHPVSRFATATPPKEGNGPHTPLIPLLRRGGGGAAGVVFFSVCWKVTDHPVSRFATATPPKEGNGPHLLKPSHDREWINAL